MAYNINVIGANVSNVILFRVALFLFIRREKLAGHETYPHVEYLEN